MSQQQDRMVTFIKVHTDSGVEYHPGDMAPMPGHRIAWLEKHGIIAKDAAQSRNSKTAQAETGEQDNG